MAAAEEHANTTRAQEEAEKKENTQAQDKEPRSSNNSSTADPVHVLAKTFQGFQRGISATGGVYQSGRHVSC